MHTEHPEPIDATPTWAGVLPILLHALAYGDDEAKKAAREELARMARAADAYNDRIKAQP